MEYKNKHHYILYRKVKQYNWICELTFKKTYCTVRYLLFSFFFIEGKMHLAHWWRFIIWNDRSHASSRHLSLKYIFVSLSRKKTIHFIIHKDEGIKPFIVCVTIIISFFSASFSLACWSNTTRAILWHIFFFRLRWSVLVVKTLLYMLKVLYYIPTI